MATPVPKNVAAALGLVPTVITGVRRLPGKAVQLPVIAVGTALSGLEVARREYDELAERGEQLIARLRGTAADEVPGEVQVVTQRAKDGSAAQEPAQPMQPAQPVQPVQSVQSVQSVQQTLPVDEPAEPAAPTSGGGRVDSAATPEVIAQVEKIAGNVAAPLVTDAAELPLADYDHMTLGALRGRLRSLDLQQLVQLRDYEKSKGDRLPVVTMLDNRIAKLANGESAPTGTTPDTPSPKASTETKPPKKVNATAAAENPPTPPHAKVRIT